MAETLGSNTKATDDLGILQNGVAMPYLALFDREQKPICIKDEAGNPIPLGARVSKFEFKSTIKSKDTNLLTLTIQVGDVSLIDSPALSEGSALFIQWGYIYPNGAAISCPYKVVVIRDVDALFNTQEVTLTLKCIDKAIQINHTNIFKPNTDPDVEDAQTFSDFLDSGLGNNIGVIIKRYNNG